jgi:trehalose 6-phosphate phosphatase
VTDGETPRFRSNSEAIADWLDDADGLALGVDFDGTLAPIGDDPSQTEIRERARAALEHLASLPSVAVIVVSGRQLDDLIERVGVSGVDYAGNHGLELRQNGETSVVGAAEAYRTTIDEICATLGTELDAPGVLVENKGITATIHYRETPDEHVDRVVATVEEVVAAAEADLRISAGKQIREIRPDVDYDKGHAMQAFVSRAPDDWRTMYFGDDVTDEDAFAAIQPDGIGVYVGPARETSADYRIPDSEDVPGALEWLSTQLHAADAEREE